MSQKYYSLNTKISTQDNVKIIRIQSNKIHKSHNNLLAGQVNKVDQETLAFQNNQLKCKVNSMNDEIQTWKNKYQQLERDATQNSMFDNNRTFLITLKKQLKKLEGDYSEKMKQIEEYKRMSSITRYQELQVEIYNYQQQMLLQQQEIFELKEKLKQSELPKIDDLYQFQEQQIAKITKINHELSTQAAQYKSEKNLLLGQQDQLQIQLTFKEREIKKLNKIIKTMEEQINNQPALPKTRQQIYKESVENAQLQEQIQKLEYKYQLDMYSKQSEIDTLKQQLKESEETRQQLEKIQQQFAEPGKLESRQDSSRKLKVSLNNSGVSQQQQSYSLLRQSSQQQKRSVQIEMTKSQNNQEYTNFDGGIDEVESVMQNSASNRKQKKIIRVNLYDVAKFGLEIRYKLLSKETTIQEVEELFEKFDKQIKIHDLLDLLLQEPFKIQSYEDRKLIARYLVEDNNEDYVCYDALKSNDVQIVLSVFKQLIGKYDLFTKREITVIETELKQVFEKIQFSLNDAIQSLTTKKKYLKPGQCERNDYEQAMRSTEINLTPRQLEYIYFLNYTFFQDMSIIYHQNIITYFNKAK